MIISKIQGGLGNQMFQYAYGRSLAYKEDDSFYMDISFYQNQFSNTKRKFLLDKFSNTYIYLNFNSSYKPICKIHDNFCYRNIEYSNRFNYYLDGYWQSEKYFKGIENIIKNDFAPSIDVLEKLKKTPLIDTNTVSLHIRRTDYVTSNGYHPVQSIDYYKNAIDAVGYYDYIFIFSDDIQWCKDNLHFDNMIFMEGFSEIEDMYLMSMCRNNIIANSTFSWWGSWLNSNPDKMVIYPSKWFGDNININESDIIPSTWIKI